MAIPWRWYLAACAVSLASAAIAAANDGEADCRKCHRALAQKAVLHAPLNTGCATCHADLDAAVVPHKAKGKLAHGLVAPLPELCHRCHDRKSFEGSFTHAPAAAGQCLACHDPHGSERPGLGRQTGAALCLTCHAEIKNRPHVLAGFSGKGHPLGEELKRAATPDPLRPGRLFYCASCHEPHRADHARLTRFDAKSMTGYCSKCHRI